MKLLTDPSIEKYRSLNEQRSMWGREVEEFAPYGGIFRVPVLDKKSRARMLVIVSRYREGHEDEPPWNHVSASLPNRCPTWEEMCKLKDIFFEPHETAMQLHPPADENISNHNYCLHIWEPVGIELPVPPSFMVGMRELGTLKK